MKTLLASICLLLFPVAAFGGSVQVLSLSTNEVQATTTNTFNDVIGCEGQTSVWTQIQFNCGSAAETDDNVLAFQNSLDGSVWLDLSTVTVSITGTNTSTTLTNLATGGLPLVRLQEWRNDESGPGRGITNIVIKYYKE